jgi:hypothetical protein
MPAKTSSQHPKSRSGAKSSRDKVRAYRKRMRAKGLRLVQMWVPDLEVPKSAADAHRQSLLANRSSSAALDQAWVEALAGPPPRGPLTFADIADVVGSVDGLPPDLSTNLKKYLRAGYGRKRSR